MTKRPGCCRSRIVKRVARVAEESAHAEKVEFLKKTNDQLKANLESLLSAKK